MERKFLHSLFYKVEKDVCIKKAVQQENIGDQKNARKNVSKPGKRFTGDGQKKTERTHKRESGIL
jgi:hypothetical protein